MSGLRVLLVHPDPRLPSSRIRVEALAPWLEARGLACEVAAYPAGLRARRALARRARAGDAVVWHGRLPTATDAALWRGAGVPVVFDFDDALRYRPRPRRGSFESGTRRRRFERMVALADAFACGSRHLAALVEASGKPAAVIPSAVPLDVPVRRSYERRGPLRVGWVGGRGNLASLDLVRGPLAALARETELVLAVVSDAPWDAPGVPTEHVPWALATQERELARLDVGVMPLEDTPWTRGKCAYKLLQYMAAGVPAAASPVGANADVVRDGETGLLAASPEAWRDALGRLAGDAELRARLGRAGRAEVERGYGYDTVAARWESLLREVVAAGAAGSRNGARGV